MSGAFKALSLPGREATPTTRLTLLNEELHLVAHLSAMTVLHGDLGARQTHLLNLCPIPCVVFLIALFSGEAIMGCTTMSAGFRLCTMLAAKPSAPGVKSKAQHLLCFKICDAL